jgi:hypothetical protein
VCVETLALIKKAGEPIPCPCSMSESGRNAGFIRQKPRLYVLSSLPDESGVPAAFRGICTKSLYRSLLPELSCVAEIAICV